MCYNIFISNYLKGTDSMVKEYIQPQFEIVSLVSEEDIAVTISNGNDIDDDKEDGYGPWVPMN